MERKVHWAWPHFTSFASISRFGIASVTLTPFRPWQEEQLTANSLRPASIWLSPEPASSALTAAQVPPVRQARERGVLRAGLVDEVRTLLALFDDEFFSEGVVARLKPIRTEVEALTGKLESAVGSLRPEVDAFGGELSKQIDALDAELAHGRADETPFVAPIAHNVLPYIGAQILITETAYDLVVTVKPGNHENLLIKLR